MKATITLTLICLLGVVASGYSQSGQNTATDSAKQMNLMDEQVKVLNSVFELGGATENPLGGATNYMELLEQSNFDPELKKELKERYKIYDLSLDPKKKDSLALLINKKLKEAMQRSLNDPINN